MSPRAMKLKYRTVFISDVHLGFSGSHARDLAKLLKRIKCDKLYLVGDIIDMWRLKQRWHWPQEHNEVVRRILKLANKGTEVIYVPGNHDEAARQFTTLEFGGVEIRKTDIHETQNGRKLLITHGDQFDLVVKHSRMLSMLGGMAYDWLVCLNIYYNRIRALFGLKYWSLSHFVKMKVKNACTFISRFEQALAEEAKRQNLDGVVCGHIHKAEHTEIEGCQYYNCGDWVESCTLIVEHRDGTLEVIDGLELIEALEHERRIEKEEKQARKKKRHKKSELLADLQDESWLHEDEPDDTEFDHHTPVSVPASV